MHQPDAKPQTTPPRVSQPRALPGYRLMLPRCPAAWCAPLQGDVAGRVPPQLLQWRQLLIYRELVHYVVSCRQSKWRISKADAAHEVGTRSDLRRLRQAVLTFVVVVVAHAGEAREKAWESNRERECQSSETPTTAYARWTGYGAGVLIASAQALVLGGRPPRTYALRQGWADVPELAMWAARG